MKKKWCDSLCAEGKHWMKEIRQPVVRRSVHYHCGIYPREGSREPMASLNFDHDCSMELVKVLAIAGAVALTAAAISTVTCTMIHHHNCKRCRQD